MNKADFQTIITYFRGATLLCDEAQKRGTTDMCLEMDSCTNVKCFLFTRHSLKVKTGEISSELRRIMTDRIVSMTRIPA